MRIYEYVTTSGFTNSDYLTSGLNLGPNSVASHMLNYIGQDIVDVNVKRASVTKIEPTQIATGVWYASQYEIAYDPRIAGSTYQQIGLNWTLKWTNISEVNMGGTSTGTLNGTISTAGSSFNLGGALATGALEAVGLSVFDNNKGSDAAHPGNGNHLGLPASIFEAALNGMKGGLTGIVTNVLSGIFGGSSGGTTQQVNLTLNTNITLTGSITGSGALIPDPGLGLGVPGTSNSQSATGLVPYYDKPMGVFYISARPIVDVSKTEEHSDTVYYTYDFEIEQNSFQVIYNPEVLNIATIENLQEQVLLIDPPVSLPYVEKVGAHNIGYPPARFGPDVFNGYWWGVAVRISFDVVPKNGGPKSTIVKTFWADTKQI